MEAAWAWAAEVWAEIRVSAPALTLMTMMAERLLTTADLRSLLNCATARELWCAIDHAKALRLIVELSSVLSLRLNHVTNGSTAAGAELVRQILNSLETLRS